jgi:hypothetical protein
VLGLTRLFAPRSAFAQRMAYAPSPEAFLAIAVIVVSIALIAACLLIADRFVAD